MISFEPLASSSAGNAYIVRAGGAAPLLIDCGVRFPIIQKALDFKVTGLAGCLVSHGHGDHCLAVPSLLAAGVDIYASEGTWRSLPGVMGHHRAHTLPSCMGEFTVGDWTVIAFPVRHDADGTLGFAVRHSGEQLVYLTDTAFSDYQFPNTKYWAIEANWGEGELRANSRSGRIHGSRVQRVASNHMSIERVERLLSANDLSQCEAIYLLHLSDENSDAASFKDRIQRLTGIPTYIADKTSDIQLRNGKPCINCRPGLPCKYHKGHIQEVPF